MNTTRRTTKVLSLVAAASVAIAACGSDDDSGDTDEDTTEATDAAEGDTETTEAMEEGDTETTEAMEEGDTETTEAMEEEGEEAEGGESAGGASFAYGNAQEFSNYNNNLGTSNSVKNSIILNEVQPNPFNFAGPDGGLVLDEELMDSADVTSEDPLTIEYVVNADAAWSDGEPIDCDDFQLQYYANNGTYLQLDDAGEPVVDEETEAEVFLFDLVGTTGYDQIDTLECSEDGKTITATYATPFADWQSLFGGQVPAHVIARESGIDDIIGAFEADDRESIEAIAETYNTLYTVDPGTINPDTMLSGGALAFGSWEAGQSFTLVPNENYWGTPAASEEIVVRYIAEEAQAQALANGEINAMDPQPTPDLLGQLDSAEGVTVEPGGQYTWEHFDFNFNNEAFQDFAVREAFAKCLPRQQMVDNLIVPLQPEAEILNNRWIQPFEPGYEDTSGGLYDEVDIEGAQQILADAGLEGMEVRIGWFDNGGNQRRTDQVALTIESCNQAGFNMVDAGSETFFDVELAAGDWDIAMFAWAGSPLRSGGTATYRPGTGNNVGAVDIPEIQPLMDELEQSPDPERVDELANEIDTILWEELATIPVFSFPGVVAYSDNADGIVYNPSQNGLTFNAAEWQLA
ncbi:ABC transporter family substrate-binding protein [Ilumatobacter nonamiensis]|uniref:ABC transporter family substrate-binding protein n=1 Tax=Ilumatobacter nonamiensis TaxID=467093 RepID=UPI00034D8211|nr:ABC transporter family substrate-binding protein [Ilumatobacter nonamiensis]